MVKKCLKALFIYTLSLCLIELGTPVVFPAIGHVITKVSAEELVEEEFSEAPSTAREHSLQDSLSFYKNVSLAQNPQNVFETNGRSVVSWTQDFISDEANKDALNTDEGRELLAYHNKFLTYQETKERLEKCMADAREEYDGSFLGWEFNNVEKYAKDAEKRILGGLIATDKSNFDCHRGLTEKTSLDELFASTLLSTDTLNQTSFQEDIYDNSFKKIIHAWLNTKFTYDKEFATEGNLSADEIAQMQAALCNEDGCNEKQTQIIDASAQDIATALHNSEMTRYSAEEAQADINNRINTLNDLVADRQLDLRGSWLKLGLGSTVDRDGAGTIEAVEFYQQEYLKLSTAGAGSLMWTDSVQDASGAMKGVRDWEWDGDNARLGNHGAVSKSDIERGIQDVLNNIKEQATKINQYEKERVNTENYFKEGNLDNRGARTLRARLDSQLEEYVNLNPSIVGEALAKSPNQANNVCAAIHENIRSGRAKQRFNNVVMGVTVAAAAALVVTGVGSAAGVALFSGVSSTMLLGGGLALGAMDMAHTGNEWRLAAQRRQAVMNTYFAGLGDDYTLIQAKEAIDNYESAQTNFYWALGFTALDAATLGGARIARANPLVLRKAAEVYNRLGGGRLNRLLSGAMRGATNVTREGYRRVIDRIAHSPLSAKFLDVLENLNDSAFKRVMDRLMGVNQRFCRPGEYSCGAFDDIIDEVGQRNTTTLSGSSLDEIIDSSIIRNSDNQPIGIMTDGPNLNGPRVEVGEEFIDGSGNRVTIFDDTEIAARPDMPDPDSMRDVTPQVDTAPPRPARADVPPSATTAAPDAPTAPSVPDAPSASIQPLEPLPANRSLVVRETPSPAAAADDVTPRVDTVPPRPVRADVPPSATTAAPDAPSAPSVPDAPSASIQPIEPLPVDRSLVVRETPSLPAAVDDVDVPRLAAIADDVVESAPIVSSQSPALPSGYQAIDPLPSNRALVPAREVLPDTVPRVEAPAAPVVPTEPLPPSRSLVLRSETPVPRVQSREIAPLTPPATSQAPELNTIRIAERPALPPPSRIPEVPRLSPPAPRVARTVNNVTTSPRPRPRARVRPVVSAVTNTGRIIEDVSEDDESEALITGEDAVEIADSTGEEQQTEESEEIVTDEQGNPECPENYTYDPEDDVCLEDCLEGETEDENGYCVPAQQETQQQGPQGFFPQMIRRGLRILGGLW